MQASDAKRQWREEKQFVKEAEIWLRVKTLSTDAFFVIKLLGRGMYGPVKLVKDTSSGHLYAMKSVPRERGVENHQTIQCLNRERTLLVEVNSVWVERLFYSFQDLNRHYLLLEYIPGGSLAQLTQQEGTLLEQQCKFYGAEMLMAINVIHRHGFMHRNIQPCNFLLDQFGHVKIVDFGCSLRFLPEETCLRMSCEASIKDGRPFISGERRDRVQLYQRKSTDTHMGLIDFMAPEVVRPRRSGVLALVQPAAPGTQYSFAADFWSFGVCLFHLLFGQLPFVGDSSEEVRDRILNWRQTLAFPMVQPISDEAKDLMKKLLCDEPCRLGLYGCEDVMSHVFFDGTDWMHMRNWSVPVPYETERDDSSSSLAPPAFLVDLLQAGNKTSSNLGERSAQTAPASFGIDHLQGHAATTHPHNGPSNLSSTTPILRCLTTGSSTDPDFTNTVLRGDQAGPSVSDSPRASLTHHPHDNPHHNPLSLMNVSTDELQQEEEQHHPQHQQQVHQQQSDAAVRQWLQTVSDTDPVPGVQAGEGLEEAALRTL